MSKHSKILIVDDEPANVRLLERILEVAGYFDFKSTVDPRRALELFQQFDPDLVLTDLHMPHLDGFALMEKLKVLIPSHVYVPIIVLTADINPETRRRALALGAHDFLVKPLDHMEVVLRIGNLLRTRMLHLELQRHNATLEERVEQRTCALDAALADLKAAQGQLVQQERLRALGNMAGGIAHDFNNSLASILGYSELLLKDLGVSSPSSKASSYVRTVITAAEDAAKMVARLREFSLPSPTNGFLSAVDLNEIVQQAVSLSMPKWKNTALASGATIEIVTKEGVIPRVQGDASELREALINLIFNAVDAMPSGGKVIIHTEASPKGLVSLKVSDNGVGMSEEIRQRCLEPYFTTKGSRGTGLGLAMVYGIVRRHAGSIEIESKAGEGTSFILELPVANEQMGIASELPRPISRELRVLVVEDQPMICEFLSECLSRDGHTVVTAANGSEGLATFRAGTFDLVLTDQAMPEMDGKQLAAAIRGLEPKQRIILLTGEQATGTGGCSSNIDLVMGKPVTLKDLREAMEQVMTRLAA
ncbi:MAG TPA: response regulator [Candidatus Saccharimonadales bacterium]|nr:response regulator [Candidatus Saccharimonadales bacterium]